MRQFIEFTNPQDGGPVKLEIAVYAETINSNLIDQLIKKGFVFTSIDADSLRAVREADYDVVMESMKELASMGFAWNEERRKNEI